MHKAMTQDIKRNNPNHCCSHLNLKGRSKHRSVHRLKIQRGMREEKAQVRNLCPRLARVTGAHKDDIWPRPRLYKHSIYAEINIIDHGALSTVIAFNLHIVLTQQVFGALFATLARDQNLPFYINIDCVDQPLGVYIQRVIFTSAHLINPRRSLDP